MMRKVGFVLLAALAAACGGSVEQESGTGGSAGTGGGGVGGVAGFGGGGVGGVAGFGGGGVGGVAGFGGGGMGGIAGAGGGCGRTYDTLDVKIEPSIGESGPTCSMKEPTLWQATGRVVKTSQNVFVLDTCPPNADCIAMHTTVSVTAKDLQLWLPENAFVSVKYTMTPAWGDCTTQLSIRNVPSWGGEKNPFSSGTQLFFAGSDGQLANGDAPFAVSKLPLGCPIGGTGCGGNPPDDYALVFNVGPGDPGTVVGMGQTASVMSPQPMQVHNLRSFESGACDDYWNWAWWAAWLPTSTGGK